MEVNRLVDLWQIILQEPRVAAKETTLLLQSELSQQVARDVLEKQEEAQKKKVLKANHTERDESVHGDKKRSLSPEEKRNFRKKTKKITTAKHANVISKSHVDVIV
jgi:hypothetical protein